MKSIIELAKQAGFERVIDVNPHTGIRTVEAYAPDSLERLANLVLEEAAKKRAKPPRKLPKRGSGALLDEQQHCYELGYREGAAAVRAAIRALKGETK
jgi:mannitol-1-phosphate/altronate dehydrogenase